MTYLIKILIKFTQAGYFFDQKISTSFLSPTNFVPHLLCPTGDNKLSLNIVFPPLFTSRIK